MTTSATETRQMHLGLFIYGSGHHVSGWRLPNAEAGAENFDLMCRLAKKAEEAKFDMVFIADGLTSKPTDHPSVVVRLEPFALMTAIAACTSRIGVAATGATAFQHPFNMARLVGTLDHISNGRGGWNVVAGGDPVAPLNFSQNGLLPHDERYAQADEFVAITKGLWDSWEDDAVVMDKQSGMFIDPSKMHTLNFKGKYYEVKGPLNMSRPPQGYPVIIQAGSSEQGRSFAAKHAEVIYTVEHLIDSAVAFAKDMRERAVNAGRDPSSIAIMPGVVPYVGRTDEEAKRKLDEMNSYSDMDAALEIVSKRLGHDMTQYPLDEPVPDLPPSMAIKGTFDAFMTLAKSKNMTLRDLRDYVGAGVGHRVLWGSPETIADGLEEWFAAGAADGFNIMPPSVPGGLDDFIELVVPVLRKRGLFRTEYTGSTLREHLGFKRPPHPAAR